MHHRPAAIYVAVVLLALPLTALAAGRQQLHLKGQVKLPPNTIPRKRYLVIILSGVEEPYSGRTWADHDGRFQLSDLTPGSYSLSIYIPDKGVIVQTVDITPSFADRKGRVEKKFEFDEDALRTQLSTVAESVVSVRQLSISFGASLEYERAQARMRQRDVRGAIEHLEKALERSPQFMEALNHLGTIYFQQREYPKAESYFRQALERDPRAFEPLVNLGGTLLAQGRDLEALEVNRHAQNARPNDALANAQLGFSYVAVGDDDSALDCFRAAEELDPGHFTHPQIPLAEIYLRRADRSAALRELQKFLELHPDAPQAQRVRNTIERIERHQNAQSAPSLSGSPPL